MACFSKRRRERQLGGSDFLNPSTSSSTPSSKSRLVADSPRDCICRGSSSPSEASSRASPKFATAFSEGKSLSEAITEAGVFSQGLRRRPFSPAKRAETFPAVLADYYIAYQRVSTGVKKKIIATLVYRRFPPITVATDDYHLPGYLGYPQIFACPPYHDLDTWNFPGHAPSSSSRITVDYRYVVTGD